MDSQASDGSRVNEREKLQDEEKPSHLSVKDDETNSHSPPKNASEA